MRIATDRQNHARDRASKFGQLNSCFLDGLDYESALGYSGLIDSVETLNAWRRYGRDAQAANA